MDVVYSEKAQRDIKFWKKSGNKPVMNKISALVADIQVNPFEGTGKPEPLKYELIGKWSRRINQEHRIVYQITAIDNTEILDILSLKGHYE